MRAAGPVAAPLLDAPRRRRAIQLPGAARVPSVRDRCNNSHPHDRSQFIHLRVFPVAVCRASAALLFLAENCLKIVVGYMISLDYVRGNV